MYEVSVYCLLTESPGGTIWPEILAGNLFWRIGGFESNPPNLLCDVIIIAKSYIACVLGYSYSRQSNRRHGVYH